MTDQLHSAAAPDPFQDDVRPVWQEQGFQSLHDAEDAWQCHAEDAAEAAAEAGQ